MPSKWFDSEGGLCPRSARLTRVRATGGVCVRPEAGAKGATGKEEEPPDANFWSGLWLVRPEEIRAARRDDERPHLSRTAVLLGLAFQRIKAEVQAAVQELGPARVGLVLGSSTGGIERTEAAVLEAHRSQRMPASYSFELSHAHHVLLDLLLAEVDLQGPAYVVSAACASGAKALAAAQRLLESGACDAVLCGGADGLCRLTEVGFASLGLISSEGCQPFCLGRAGLGLGEGAALTLLEASARPGVYLLGAGESNDAFDPTAPHPEGLGAELALRRALEDARLRPNDIDYINAHGTGTRRNDEIESNALARIFGEGVRFSSTKHRTQHQLGAAGATEAVVCVHALQHQLAPSNLTEPPPDPALPVRPLLEAAPGPLDVVLSNSFAFGGANVSLAFSRSARPAPGRVHRRIFVMSQAHWVASPEDQLPPAALMPARMRARSSPLDRMVVELYERLERALQADAAPVNRRTTSLVLASAYGELSTSLDLLAQIAADGEASPTRFGLSVHNAPLGLLTQILENRGYATAIAAGRSSLAMGLVDAIAFLARHGGEAALIAADERGPELLLAGRTFPALGIAVLLRAAEVPPLGALAELTSMSRRGDAGHEPRAPEPPRRGTWPEGLRDFALENAPHAAGLPLLAWLERPVGETTVPLGPREQAQLRALG